MSVIGKRWTKKTLCRTCPASCC